MKLGFLLTLILFALTGCVSEKKYIQLRTKALQQSQIIQDQQLQIASLEKKNTKKHSQHNQSIGYAKPPKKNITLKKVEDDNYSSDYMYPTTTPEPPQTPQTPQESTVKSNISVEKQECIGLIGQDKFDKYTKMFGSEAASLKRCKMLKSMQ